MSGTARTRPTSASFWASRRLRLLHHRRARPCSSPPPPPPDSAHPCRHRSVRRPQAPRRPPTRAAGRRLCPRRLHARHCRPTDHASRRRSLGSIRLSVRLTETLSCGTPRDGAPHMRTHSICYWYICAAAPISLSRRVYSLRVVGCALTSIHRPPAAHDTCMFIFHSCGLIEL